VLDEVLAGARRRGDTFEQALTLDALIAARSATGLATRDLERERRALTKKLGIATTPSFLSVSGSAQDEPVGVA
jgi:hypothetical protein